MLAFIRISTLAIWAAILINLVYPLMGENSQWISWVGIGLLVAHAGECLMFRKHIQRDYAGRELTGYLIVLVYGFGRTGEWIMKKPQQG